MIRAVRNVLFYKEGKASSFASDVIGKLLLVKNDISASLGSDVHIVVISQDPYSIHKKLYSFADFVYDEKNEKIVKDNFKDSPSSDHDGLGNFIMNEIFLCKKNKNNGLYSFESLDKASRRIFTKNIFKNELDHKYGLKDLDLLTEMKKDVATDINTIRDLTMLSGKDFTKNIDADTSDISLIRNMKVDRISLDKLVKILKSSRNLLDK